MSEASVRGVLLIDLVNSKGSALIGNLFLYNGQIFEIKYRLDAEDSDLQNRGHLIDHKNYKVPLSQSGQHNHGQEESISLDFLAIKSC